MDIGELQIAKYERVELEALVYYNSSNLYGNYYFVEDNAVRYITFVNNAKYRIQLDCRLYVPSWVEKRRNV